MRYEGGCIDPLYENVVCCHEWHVADLVIDAANQVLAISCTPPFKPLPDASVKGTGSVLTQEHDCAEKVVVYASHQWSKTKTQQSATDRECTSVMWAVNKSQLYVLEWPFKLITTCSALTWLLRSHTLSPKCYQ